MSTLTDFDIEFFELTSLLKTELTDSSKQELSKKLLKLNNPTYFYKYVKKHPIENHGYSSSKILNPVLVAIANMLNILKSNNSKQSMLQLLQTEMSWAYNNYKPYSLVNL